MKSVPLTLLFGAFFLTASSRGVFETYLSKDLGYLVQLGLLMLFGLACLQSGARSSPRSKFNFTILYLFSLTAVASAAFSFAFRGFGSPWIYVIVMLVFGGAMTLFSSFEFPRVSAQPILTIVGCVGLLLVGVAVLQQYGGQAALFPGSDEAALQGVVRPASLTGSYLHYPLVASLLVFVFLQAYTSLKRRLYLWFAIFFAVAVVISLSRSGAMILGLGALVFAITTRSVSNRVRSAFFGLGTLAVLPLVFQGNMYIDRLASSVQLNGLGNTGRIHHWGVGLEMWWADSPMLIGAHTGMVTNATRNLGGADSIIVESGFLQQLVNFGLIGTVLFYLLMFGTFRAIANEFTWLRAGVLAGILQTFVYQSIEVFPYMALFSITPLIAQHLTQRAPKVAAEESLTARGRNAPSRRSTALGRSPMTQGAGIQ